MDEHQTFINNRKYCFLGSVSPDGYPVIRAMLKPIKVEGAVFYLHTNTSSKKVAQFLANDKACLYFYDEQTIQGITILGDVELLQTQAEKEKYWQESYRIYYSQGEGLSDFTVIKFTGIKGEHYQQFAVHEFFY